LNPYYLEILKAFLIKSLLITVGAHGFLKCLPLMAPGSHIREVWRADPKSEKLLGRGYNKKGRLSPIKKKVPMYNNAKSNKERDRSAWLFQ
jgi:hypothetical protein